VLITLAHLHFGRLQAYGEEGRRGFVALVKVASISALSEDSQKAGIYDLKKQPNKAT